MKIWATAIALAVLLCSPLMVHSQSWAPLKHQAPFLTPGTALLLTDGSVMVQNSEAQDWWRLVPDNTGSYVNGKWQKLALMPANYGPLYYASAVLADGRVVVAGGEYNIDGSSETNKAAIYDPRANTWKTLAPPTNWSTIGDASSVVFPNGKMMISDIFTARSAILDPKTLTWTVIAGNGKQDRNAEEGWTLLRDGTVLTADAIAAPKAEKYVYQQQKWISAGNTIVRLEDPGSQELGPAVLRPDGTVFATGANASGAGHTSVYTTPAKPGQPGTWKAGPDFPDNLDIADGPAALLPNGNVLCAASPGIFHPPGTRFFEWDGANLNEVPATPNSPNISSFEGRMLLLPTGQVMFTDGYQDIEIYTPVGSADPSWAPTIASAPSTVTRGKTFVVSGTQFNGLSQANAYGDDAQSATNYPLVRLTNQATGHVFYARTHNHSTMAVATGSKTVSTRFDVPRGMETGPADLAVVANGIASDAVTVTVQ